MAAFLGTICEIRFRKKYQGGPFEALREFMPNHPEYMVDRKWCDKFGKKHNI